MWFIDFTKYNSQNIDFLLSSNINKKVNLNPLFYNQNHILFVWFKEQAKKMIILVFTFLTFLFSKLSDNELKNMGQEAADALKIIVDSKSTEDEKRKAVQNCIELMKKLAKDEDLTPIVDNLQELLNKNVFEEIYNKKQGELKNPPKDFIKALYEEMPKKVYKDPNQYEGSKESRNRQLKHIIGWTAGAFLLVGLILGVSAWIFNKQVQKNEEKKTTKIDENVEMIKVE